MTEVILPGGSTLEECRAVGQKLGKLYAEQFARLLPIAPSADALRAEIEADMKRDADWLAELNEDHPTLVAAFASDLQESYRQEMHRAEMRAKLRVVGPEEDY